MSVHEYIRTNSEWSSASLPQSLTAANVCFRKTQHPATHHACIEIHSATSFDRLVCMTKPRNVRKASAVLLLYFGNIARQFKRITATYAPESAMSTTLTQSPCSQIRLHRYTVLLICPRLLDTMFLYCDIYTSKRNSTELEKSYRRTNARRTKIAQEHGRAVIKGCTNLNLCVVNKL